MPSPERGDSAERCVRRFAVLRAAFAGTVLFATGSVAAPPPYAQDMERLAEILGSLQFLTELCDADPGSWREQMETIIALEAGGDESSEEWQARLTNLFNLGYSSFAAVYRTCTPSALTAVTLYRDAGAKIAAGITSRYGTPLPDTNIVVDDP